MPRTARKYVRASRGAVRLEFLPVTLFLMLVTSLNAQRAFEMNRQIIYEGAEKLQTNVGPGFNPLLTADGKVAFIRGRQFSYGDPFDCSHANTKNWIVLYDPETKHEEKIFDRPLEFYGRGSLAFCIFEQMQLSHDASTLYLVSPTSATSGSLAIVDLGRGSVGFVNGVTLVYVIESGSHRDELIYQRRIWHKSVEDGLEYPGYPFVHARANGEQITEISNEFFTVGGNDRVPLLREYLRKIGGTITVNGRTLP